jgi:hypothetical protein
MSIIDAIKNVFARVIRNVAKAAESLATQDVLVTANGEIVIKEPVIQRFSDKISAVVLAGAALFFLLFPFEGKAALAIGDQLMRAATYLWSGASSEGVQAQAEGFSI